MFERSQETEEHAERLVNLTRMLGLKFVSENAQSFTITFDCIFIVSGLRKGKSGLKIMLLGINITLLGGIIAVDSNSNLGGR